MRGCIAIDGNADLVEERVAAALEAEGEHVPSERRMASLVASDALQHVGDRAISRPRGRERGDRGRGTFPDATIDGALDRDSAEKARSGLASARRTDLGKRRSGEIAPCVCACDREARLCVADLVDRGLVGAPDEIGGRAERDEIERE